MPEIDESTALEMYRKMIELRLFEKRAYDLFLQNLVKGTTHLGTGQEAVAAGVSQAMNASWPVPRCVVPLTRFCRNRSWTRFSNSRSSIIFRYISSAVASVISGTWIALLSNVGVSRDW